MWESSLTARLLRDRQWFHGRRAGFVYEQMGRRFRNATDWRFMNYGYAPDSADDNIELQEDDEAERYPAQLYHFVASQADLSGREVLDVGSGRGGGASHIHRYLGPKSTTGMDLAESAVEFCNSVFGEIEGLKYVAGNAMAMPFEDQSFDALTNVESAHCYPDKSAFFNEVLRVLRPGGDFLFTDFSRVGEAHNPGLDESGFETVAETNITDGVVRAMSLDSARREGQIATRVPFGFRRLFSLWAGTDKSWIYNDFSEGRRSYMVYHARKPIG